MENEFMIDPLIIEDAQKRYTKALGEDAPPMRFGVCLYTDGGGKIETNYGLNNVYNASYGVHAYVYIKDFTVKQGNGVTGYTLTDRGYILNGMVVADIEITDVQFNKTPEKIKVKAKTDIVPLVYFNCKGGLEGGTNNTGESTAFMEALLFVGAISKQIPVEEICVVLDSDYVIGNFLSLDKYHQNGWRKRDGNQIANLDLWKQIDQVYRDNITPEQNFCLYWTKGHDDNFGNQQADVLASRALVGAVNGYYGIDKTISPAKGFWSKRIPDIHPFLLETNWYFKNTIPYQKEDGRVALCLGLHDMKADERYCQPNSTDNFALVYLNEIPPVMENIYALSKEVGQEDCGYSYDNIFYSNLRNVLNQQGMEFIEDNKGQNIRRDINRRRLLLPNKKTVAVMFDPPRLAPNAFTQHYPLLDDILQRIANGTLRQNETLNDVTDTFFETKVVKGKEENILAIGNNIRYPVAVKYKRADTVDSVYKDFDTEVILTLGITAPRRRVLSSIKDLTPKVSVLTVLDSGTQLHFYTIVELSTGEMGIWTNPFANQKLIIP